MTGNLFILLARLLIKDSFEFKDIVLESIQENLHRRNTFKSLDEYLKRENYEISMLIENVENFNQCGPLMNLKNFLLNSELLPEIILASKLAILMNDKQAFEKCSVSICRYLDLIGSDERTIENINTDNFIFEAISKTSKTHPIIIRITLNQVDYFRRKFIERFEDSTIIDNDSILKAKNELNDAFKTGKTILFDMVSMIFHFHF